MRPVLILQPYDTNTVDILKCFAFGKPLSCDQINFLEWHQKQLTSSLFDPVYKYYIESVKRHKTNTSFLLSTEKLTAESVKQFKNRLRLFLQQKSTSRVVVSLTQEQFLKFKELNTSELIFWHGNQSLTGAPYFPGGIPPVIYFQWGNYFGVAKYVILAGEKALKANILVYFEDMQERNLHKCVEDYGIKLENEFNAQKEILYEHKIDPSAFNEFIIKTPILALNPMKKIISGGKKS